MTDSRLRELERRFRETGTAADEGAWLLERVRAGELRTESLQVLSLLGHEAATAAVGVGPQLPTHAELGPLLRGEGASPPAWLARLHELTGDLGVRRLTTSAVRGSPYASNVTLHAVEAWTLTGDAYWWERCRNHLAGDGFFMRETAKLVVIWGGKQVAGKDLLIAAARLLGLLLMDDQTLRAGLQAACAQERSHYLGQADAVRDRVAVTRTDWWLMSSSFPDLNWARLRIYGSGAASIFDMDGAHWEFGSEQEARDWLVEDEYTNYANLDESDEEALRRPVATVRPPVGESDAELLPQMFVVAGSDAHVAARLADFERRAGHSAHTVSPEGWRYVTVHPCADETDLLNRIGATPADCRSVDAYWHAGHDIAFLQVHTVGSKAAGLWIRRAGNDSYLFNVSGAVEEPFITHDVLHRVMRRFSRWGFTGADTPTTREIGDRATRIEEPTGSRDDE